VTNPDPSGDDDPATRLLFTADDRGEVNGTARIWPWRLGAVPHDARQRYALNGFSGLVQLRAGEVGGSCWRRGTAAAWDLRR
jgi:hypothetical protein